MKQIISVSIAAACALGVSAAFAQTVQRGGATVSEPTQTVAQASTTAPVQVAQAGGAATGAAAGGATATVGVGTTVLIVGASIAAIAIATNSGSTVTH